MEKKFEIFVISQLSLRNKKRLQLYISPFAGVKRVDFLGVLPDLFLGVLLGVRLHFSAGMTDERFAFLLGVFA
jgi:hypothetical protein